MEYFIKEENVIEIDESEKNMQLIQSILDTYNNLKKAHINFDFAEEELIDFYTYEIKANQSKLDYLTKLAKSKNLIFNSEIQNNSNKVRLNIQNLLQKCTIFNNQFFHYG